MKTLFLIRTSRLSTDRSTTPQRLALGRSVWSRQISYIGALLPLAHHRSPPPRAPPLRRRLDPNSDRARGSARRRLLPGSAESDPPADGCSLGSAGAGEAEGCAAAGEESPASARAVAGEESPASARAGPELADMLAGGRSLAARRIRRPQPEPPRLAPPRVPPAEMRADLHMRRRRRGGPASAPLSGRRLHPPGLLCLVCTVDHI
jgi:hypothetical protein